MSCISCHFIPLKPLTLQMDSVKLLDVLASLPVSHAILPRAVCFSTSRPANHAICSFIDSSGYASGPIRRCLFIDYIINCCMDILCIKHLARTDSMPGCSKNTVHRLHLSLHLSTNKSLAQCNVPDNWGQRQANLSRSLRKEKNTVLRNRDLCR